MFLTKGRIMLIMLSMIMLTPVALSAFSNKEFVVYSTSTGNNTIYIINISSGIIRTQFNLGYTPVDLTSSKDGFFVVVQDTGTSRNVKTYNGALSVINQFTVPEATHTLNSCYRVNSTRYFCSDSGTLIEYDSGGNEISSKTVNQVFTGDKVKIWDFVNTSGTRWVLLGADARISGANRGANFTYYRLFNYETEEWISYMNSSNASVGSTFFFNGFVLLDQANNRVFVSGDDVAGVIGNFFGSRITVWNINSSFVNTSLAFQKSISPDTFFSVTSDTFSYLRLNITGGILEDGGAIRSFTLPTGTYSQIIELYNITITQQAQQGLSGTVFESYEFSDTCGINSPVPNVQCSISSQTVSSSCTTAIVGANSSEFVKVRKFNAKASSDHGDKTVTSIFGSGNLGFYKTPYSNPITSYSKNLHQFLYTFPTDLRQVNLSSINFTSNPFWKHDGSTNFGLGIQSQFEAIDCSMFDPSPVVLNAQISRLFPYNTTHWFNRTLECVGNSSSTIDSITTNFDFTSFDGLDFPVILGQGGSQNIPVDIDNFPLNITPQPFVTHKTGQKNDIVAFGSTFLFVNQSTGKSLDEFFLMGWSNITLTYLKNTTGKAQCSVGTLEFGLYNYYCIPPDNYTGLANETIINGTISITSANTTIPIKLQKVRPLTLNISLVDENVNPVIGAQCSSNTSGTVFSNVQGECIFTGVRANTIETITIISNTPVAKTLIVSFQIGDYYNSQRAGIFLDNFCSFFDGQYKYIVNVDRNELFEMEFHAFDGLSTNPVQYAIFIYDGAKSCTTGADGMCTIQDVSFDGIRHTFNVSKRPFYLDKSGTFLHTEVPISVDLNRNGSIDVVNPEGINPATLGGNVIGGQLDSWLKFMLSPISIIMLLLAYVSFKVGQPTIGIFALVIMFVQILPIWFAVIITVFVLIFITKSGREIIFGKTGELIESIRQ